MANKKRGLGKGLGALIPSDPDNQKYEGELKEIKVSQIIPNPGQPRMIIDTEKLQELIESVKEHGVVQPVVVRPVGREKYELIAGERRWRACKELKKEYIPALVKNYNDLEASAIALIENIQRENLNALEEAQAYNRLMNEYGLTQEDISKRLGKSRPFIANMVRLLNLPPEIKEMVMEGSLTAGHARALIIIKDKDKQMAAALKIMRRQLNVRQTEQLVKRMVEEKQHNNNMAKKKDASIENSEKKIGNILGTPVAINKGKKGKGKIVIKFNNEDELNKLIHLLAGE